MISAEQRQTLIETACAVRAQAYAPYSNFTVGAAILGEDGHIYTGVNVENASYGLTSCAERSAIFHMITQGTRRIQAVAVCTSNGVSPCGACRQVIAEFAGDVPIYISDAHGNVRDTTLHRLMPDLFGPSELIAGQQNS